MKRARWVCCISAAFALLLLAAPPPARAEALRIDVAQFTRSDAAQPPLAADWRAVRLPHNWNVSQPNVTGFGWYSLRFERPAASAEPVALYLPRISMNAAYYVNGSFLASGGRFDEPVARNWNRAQYYLIPPALLKPGVNTLHVRLFAYANTGGGVSQAWIGPASELQPRYKQRYLLQTVLPQLSNLLGAALGIFVLLLWTRRSADSVHIYFCLLALLWTARGSYLVVRDIPVSTFHWELFTMSSVGVCAVLGTLTMMRYCGWRRPRLERGIWAYVSLAAIVMWFAGPERLYAVASACITPLVSLMVVCAGIMTRQALRKKTAESALLAAAWIVVAVLSCRDTTMRMNLLPFDALYSVSYGMTFMFLVMAWSLTQRFTHALRRTAQLNAELEQRVAQKHAELEENFARMRDLQRQHAIAEERRRLMGEMHDGVGSQVIATLDAVERGAVQPSEVARDLREILDSLRLTIDSLQPSENDLLTVLGNLRYRLEGRLKRQGIRLNWQVSDLPPLPSLTPQNVLHILRILQECFTNIIKHAQAGAITVTTAVEHDHVLIRVADNGRGMQDQREGRGLASMRRRAQQLGAALTIDSSAAGTMLSLRIARAAGTQIDAADTARAARAVHA